MTGLSANQQAVKKETASNTGWMGKHEGFSSKTGEAEVSTAIRPEASRAVRRAKEQRHPGCELGSRHHDERTAQVPVQKTTPQSPQKLEPTGKFTSVVHDISVHNPAISRY